MQSRRSFLAGGVLAASATIASGSSFAHEFEKPDPFGFDLTKGVRTLNLYRPEVQERLNLTYLENGVWVPGAYETICWHLRDVKAGVATRMDPSLIAILDWISQHIGKYGYWDPIQILSGYRTLTTNLRTEGASKKSQHMLGKAVDFRIPGLSVEYLGELMNWLAKGGIGLYQSKNFIHIDTASFRIWQGIPRKRG